jgi:hypothetical protein
MCWNAEVSLKTFMYGLCSAVICAYLGTIPMSVIYITMSITSMQLLEYFAWTYLDNKQVIYYLSLIGAFLIFLQVFLNSYFLENPIHQQIMLTLLFVFMVGYFIFIFPTTKFNMKRGINGHLEWEWLDWPTTVIIPALFFYIMPNLLNKKYLSSIGITSLIIFSLYNYYQYKTWGTMWCYFSNVLWFYFVFVSVYKYYYRVKNVSFWIY